MNTSLQHRRVGQGDISNPKFKYEILSKAMINDCIEIIENFNNFIELELNHLIKKGFVNKSHNKYNCNPTEMFREIFTKQFTLT